MQKITNCLTVKDINCDTLTKYCLLFPNDRLHLGIFYKRPYSMLCNEWEKFDNYIQQNYPIQFFFRETFTDFFYFKYKRVEEFFHYLKCLFFKRYHIVKLRSDPTWRDFDINVEQAIQVLFFDYIENEANDLDYDKEDKITNQNWKKVAKDCYDFLKNIEPHKQKQIDKLLHELYGRENHVLGQKIDEKKFKKLNQLEEDLAKQKTEVLKQIVEHRHYFWT